MDRKKNRELVLDLEEAFAEGKKLTVETMVKNYFKPKNPFDYLVAKQKIRSLLSTIRNHFKFRDGLWFGNIDNTGRYGIITTKEEAQFALMRYYRFVKGNIAGATFLVGDAKKQGLLPDGMKNERVLVARVEEEDEDSD
jgi:hypothetical protein